MRLRCICGQVLKILFELLKVRVVEEGDLFGEMSVLKPGKRSSTVTALEPTRLVFLPRSLYLQMLNSAIIDKTQQVRAL